MLIPNTTGHVVHTSQPRPRTAPAAGPTPDPAAELAPDPTAQPAGEPAVEHVVEHVVRDLEVIAWQELADGRVVPLVADPHGHVVDATSLDGFEGIYASPRQLASADGWYAEFLDASGAIDRAPVAAWAAWVGEVIGLIGGDSGHIELGKVVTSGERGLSPVAGGNFLRYVHQSELVQLTEYPSPAGPAATS